jgi:hypothetical protein
MPKDIDTKDPVDHSGKGEDNPKVTKPLSPRILEENAEAINDDRRGATSPRTCPRVEDSSTAASFQVEDDSA